MNNHCADVASRKPTPFVFDSPLLLAWSTAVKSSRHIPRVKSQKVRRVGDTSTMTPGPSPGHLPAGFMLREEKQAPVWLSCCTPLSA